MRIKRNLKQSESLSQEENTLLEKNYMYQELDFPKHIITSENWKLLRTRIEESSAKVVFIDSITRLNHGKLEDGTTAEEILSKLRSIAYDLNITLIGIHHTPKMEGRMISMDCIKGSAVFAQESDFAIGLNILNKKRYVKDVFFRYKGCDDEVVREYSINENTWLEHNYDIEEESLLRSTDGRINDNPRRVIKRLINSSTDITYGTKELVSLIEEKTLLKERRIKDLLTELSSQEEIKKIGRGKYAAANFREEGGQDG